MSLRDLVFHLLFAFCAGTIFTFSFVRAREVGIRYFLYHGLGSLAILTAAYWWLWPSRAADGVWLFAAFWGSTLAYCLLATDRFAPLIFLAVLVNAVAFERRLLGDMPQPLQLNLLASTLLGGFSMAAMWLGHWYLTQPKLSIAELKRVTAALIFLIAVRFAWGTYVTGGLLAGKNEMEIYRYLMSSTAGIFVLMRYLWGLLLPLLLSYFIWGTVRIRSTQSATGLLYVLVLSILTGETLSQYLAFSHGIYF